MLGTKMTKTIMQLALESGDAEIMRLLLEHLDAQHCAAAEATLLRAIELANKVCGTLLSTSHLPHVCIWTFACVVCACVCVCVCVRACAFVACVRGVWNASVHVSSHHVYVRVCCVCVLCVCFVAIEENRGFSPV